MLVIAIVFLPLYALSAINFVVSEWESAVTIVDRLVFIGILLLPLSALSIFEGWLIKIYGDVDDQPNEQGG